MRYIYFIPLKAINAMVSGICEGPLSLRASGSGISYYLISVDTPLLNQGSIIDRSTEEPKLL